MDGLSITELKVGQSASFTKTVTEHDVYTFAGVTGDLNPAHINEEYAKGTQFKGRIAHGLLSVGFLSAVMAMQLPGPGSIYLGQEVRFTAPVRMGDTITAIATVSELFPEKNIVKLKNECVNQRGETVITGVATVMPPRKGSAR